MTSKSDALVSVVMPVHNAMPYLDEAVESILNQSLSRFEFVIYDDASTDGSAARLQQWAERDQRIRLFCGERKLGPAASSNKVVDYASSPLIARMDADDISTPDRLDTEAQILAAHGDAGMVASLCDVIDSHGHQIRGPELWRLVRRSCFTPFPHGSMMFRRDLYDAVGGYRPECDFWEDLDFALRVSKRARILVLPRPLYRYRQSTLSTRISSEQHLVEDALDLRYRSIGRVQRNRSYDDLLVAVPRPTEGDIDPRVFVSLGLLSLWSGQRPAMFARLFKRARLRFNAATIMAVAWLSCASISPTAVRLIMNLASRCRNCLVRRRMADDRLIEWRPSISRDGPSHRGRQL